MKFRVEKAERYTLLKLEEETLNSFIAPQLKSEFVILHNEGVANLILDLSEVSFADSSGLSAILTANRLWDAAGTFVLTGLVHDNVSKLMKITRLDKVFTIIPTEAEAIDYVLLSEMEREIGGESEDA
ncbi:MAG: STAS domain-containing protein [Bacteroidota bacterium]